ncbi:unnamed protein product [Schistosoma curassoni]|nr:unnamed protein product [Schistosoma curassoni]
MDCNLSYYSVTKEESMLCEERSFMEHHCTSLTFLTFVIKLNLVKLVSQNKYQCFHNFLDYLRCLTKS